ncbi:hypothetical protein SUGI_1105860 [Cryptomeria japonica]|nr:hypothetical protein SUGI_1105860 [Cryptomeria japonica]
MYPKKIFPFFTGKLVEDLLEFECAFCSSVLSWGIAEVPQIITNYKEKSTEGMSLTFLMTWVIGDLLNLFGCWLEPATLPTQFYMAMLYTVTTMALLSQALYYGYMHKRVEAKIKRFLLWVETKREAFHLKEEPKEDASKLNMDEKTTDLSVAKPASTSPIPVASSQLAGHIYTGRDLYYMSARSLARSHTPTAGSFIAQIRGSWPRTSIGLIVDEESPVDNDTLTSLLPANSSVPPKSKSLFCAAGATFFLGALNLHLPWFKKSTALSGDMKVFVLRHGRKLLEEANGFNQSPMQQGEWSSMIGTYMGWMMAAIYMGGRLPQIFLNIKRGTAEGLNPLMFMFAIIGNATYVGSILIRSTEWAKLKPNMPWLVDAGVCVLLDCFIIAQFIYFRSQKPTDQEDGDEPYEACD